jgi:hypothetical protein
MQFLTSIKLSIPYCEVISIPNFYFNNQRSCSETSECEFVFDESFHYFSKFLRETNREHSEPTNIVVWNGAVNDNVSQPRLVAEESELNSFRQDNDFREENHD